MGDQLADAYLRFAGIKGQSMDVMHPGDSSRVAGAEEKQDGWLSITSFKFSISFSMDRASGGRSGGRRGGTPPTPPGPNATPAEIQSYNNYLLQEGNRIREENRRLEEERRRSASAGVAGGIGSQPGSGRISPRAELPKFTFNKYVDVASDDLFSSCHSGKAIDLAVFEVCRYGGQGTQYKEIKIPFFRATFRNVRVVEIEVSPMGDPLPEEQCTCEYKSLVIETIWTDNETGKRRTLQPNRSGWNFESNKLFVEE